MANEIWKDINGYEGRYLISNKGNVKSIMNNRGDYREKIRKIRCAKNGYLYLNLWKNGKSETKMIHRLVAEHFILNNDNLPAVNHIDGNKLNNNIENLEWCTYKYNTAHAIKKGLMHKETLVRYGKDNYMYNKHGKDNPNSISVIQYNQEGKKIKYWDNIQEAQTTLKIYHISDCCKGKRMYAGGYIWKYAKEVS